MFCPNCKLPIVGDPGMACVACRAAMPREEWPRWAKLFAKRRIDADKGVGDTVQRYAAKVGGEQFKRASKWLGIPCGCTERQGEWNRLYPYD